jgi:hypothetical protein
MENNSYKFSYELDENKFYIKMVALDAIYKFVVEKFLFETVYNPKYLF